MLFSVVSEDLPVHSSVAGTGSPLTFGMVAKQEWVDEAAWDDIIAMNYKPEFVGASDKANAFSFTFKTGPSTGYGTSRFHLFNQ